LRVKTRGYQGNILKRARVYTNEKGRGFETVSIKAFVNVPIYVTSRYVHLRGPADRKVVAMVTVRGDGTKHLALEESQFTLADEVAYRIEEVKAGKLFRLHFTRMPGNVGSHRGVLKLKTNYPEQPELTIWITAQYRRAARPQQ
jgi:hypothetical protein